MVSERQGQSTVEFALILTLLTFFGFFMAWKLRSADGGAVAKVQTQAETKIGND